MRIFRASKKEKQTEKKKSLSLGKTASILAIITTVVGITGYSLKDVIEWAHLQKSVSKKIKFLQRETESIRICDIPESISSLEEVTYIRDYQTCFKLLQEEYSDIQNKANAAIGIKDSEQKLQHLLETEIRLAQLGTLSKTLVEYQNRYLLFLNSSEDESLALSKQSLDFFESQLSKKMTLFESSHQEVERHLDNTKHEIQKAFQQASPESQIESASKVLTKSLKDKPDWEFLERANDIHKGFMSFCNVRIIDLYIYHSQKVRDDASL